MRALSPYRRDFVSILGDVDRLPGMQAGSQRFIVLAIILPLAIVVCTALLLRFLIRRAGVRLIPARASPRPERSTSSIADARVGGSLSR